MAGLRGLYHHLVSDSFRGLPFWSGFKGGVPYFNTHTPISLVYGLGPSAIDDTLVGVGSKPVETHRNLRVRAYPYFETRIASWLR